MIVMKFGGTLMGSSDAIRHSASLVASSVKAGTRVVVVPSAMSGVTDQLLKIASSAEQGEIAFAADEIASIKGRHLSTARDLGAVSDSSAVKKLEGMFSGLEQTVNGIYLSRTQQAQPRPDRQFRRAAVRATDDGCARGSGCERT